MVLSRETVNKKIKVFSTGIFYTKVIDNKAESNIAGPVAEQAGSIGLKKVRFTE